MIYDYTIYLYITSSLNYLCGRTTYLFEWAVAFGDDKCNPAGEAFRPLEESDMIELIYDPSRRLYVKLEAIYF